MICKIVQSITELMKNGTGGLNNRSLFLLPLKWEETVWGWSRGTVRSETEALTNLFYYIVSTMWSKVAGYRRYNQHPYVPAVLEGVLPPIKDTCLTWYFQSHSIGQNLVASPDLPAKETGKYIYSGP